MKKEILNEINEILKTKEFLEREDVKEISKKFNIINGILIKQIQELGIPCMAANLKLSLHGFGIPVEENLCTLEKFNKLGDWRLIIFKNSKINVSYNCKICNAPGKSRLAHIIQRKFFKSEPICSKCIEREVSKTNEWKNTNSIAQLIAQNKPEQVEKNKQAQIERFKNPEARIKASEASKKNWENSEYREKLVKIAQDKWKNPEYAKNVIEKSRNSQKCGMYKEVYYNSSYELAFLLKIEDSDKDGILTIAKGALSSNEDYTNIALGIANYYEKIHGEDVSSLKVKTQIYLLKKNYLASKSFLLKILQQDKDDKEIKDTFFQVLERAFPYEIEFYKKKLAK